MKMRQLSYVPTNGSLAVRFKRYNISMTYNSLKNKIIHLLLNFNHIFHTKHHAQSVTVYIFYTIKLKLGFPRFSIIKVQMLLLSNWFCNALKTHIAIKISCVMDMISIEICYLPCMFHCLIGMTLLINVL